MTITEELETFFNDPLLEEILGSYQAFIQLKKFFTETKEEIEDEDLDEFIQDLFSNPPFSYDLETIRSLNDLSKIKAIYDGK